MRELLLKNDDCATEVKFALHDYGRAKSKDFRIHFRTKVSGQVHSGGRYSKFDGQEIPNEFTITVEECCYSLTPKDLDRVITWATKAKENLVKMIEDGKND